MIHLLWAILNFGLYVITICFFINKSKEIKEKVGSFVALVFVFLLLSYLDRFTDKENERQEALWKNTSNSKIENTISKDIVLEKNLISRIELSLFCGNDIVTHQIIPESGFTGFFGFTLGRDWETISITMNESSTNKWQYIVDGNMNWKILGITIYTETKSFEGQL